MCEQGSTTTVTYFLQQRVVISFHEKLHRNNSEMSPVSEQRLSNVDTNDVEITFFHHKLHCVMMMLMGATIFSCLSSEEKCY